MNNSIMNKTLVLITVLFTSITTSAVTPSESSTSLAENAQMIHAQYSTYGDKLNTFFYISTTELGERRISACWGPNTKLTSRDLLLKSRCEWLHKDSLDKRQIDNIKYMLNFKISAEKFVTNPNLHKISALRIARFIICDTGSAFVFVDNHQAPYVLEALLTNLN